MTVLNIANDGFHNNLVVLYRALVAEGTMARERLLTLCAGIETDRLRQTLNRWTELGLFGDEQGNIALRTGVPLHGSDLEKATAALPAVVRRIIFREENNNRFWEQEHSSCADLNRGLAWLLAQDVYAVDLSSHPSVGELEAHQVIDPQRRIVQNDVRWNGLRFWAVFLGFAWTCDGLVVDPTIAIRQDLPLVFDGASEMEASLFVRRLADVLPVLDSGRYRKLVEDSLDQAHWRRPARTDLLSTALSRALWRLHEAGRLRLETRADAGEIFTLQGPGGRNWHRFTHVRVEG